MFRVYYHYSNGRNYAGARSKLFPSREEAREWVKWMEENIIGFVHDKTTN